MKPFLLLLLLPSLIWYKVLNLPLSYLVLMFSLPLKMDSKPELVVRAADPRPMSFLPNKASEKRKIGLIAKPANIDAFRRPGQAVEAGAAVLGFPLERLSSQARGHPHRRQGASFLGSCSLRTKHWLA